MPQQQIEPASSGKYNKAQMKLMCLRKVDDTKLRWDALLQQDPDAFKYLRRLSFALYYSHLEGRPLTISDACQFIPAKHAATCKKYIDYARREKLVTVRKHPRDRRIGIVEPTEKLIANIALELENEISDTLELAKKIESVGAGEIAA